MHPLNKHKAINEVTKRKDVLPLEKIHWKNRLRQERIQRNWRQADLAEQLGTSPVTIQRWEKGSQTPGPYFRLKLSLLFSKSEEDLGFVEPPPEQLPIMQDMQEESVPEELPVGERVPWNAPYPRNPHFTGREDLLAILHQRLSAAEQSAGFLQLYALYGLGGIGKTQLALEYVHRYYQEYSSAFWITAEQVESITTGLLRIAEDLQLPELRAADQQEVVAAVQRWLATHRRWLLILDNLEDVQTLQNCLPWLQQGVTLVTTRRPILGTVVQNIELLPLSEEEGLLFLLRRVRLLASGATSDQLAFFARNSPGEYTVARELVVAMGGLPLALDQAGAYVEETPCRLAEYLALYRTRRAALLGRRGGGFIDHPTSVATTFSLSFKKVEQASNVAANLLRWCAFLDPESIAEEIFLLQTEVEDGCAIATDAFVWHEALREAAAYSLLKRNVQEQTLSLHRLVQAVLREEMSQEQQEQWQRRSIKRLNALFPTEASQQIWPQCERLLPHILICAATIPDHVMDPDWADLLRKAADYLRERGRYEQAAALFRRALHINEQILGFEHPQVALSLNKLANTLFDQGKYSEAKPLYQCALRIWEQALGVEHPDVARALNNLALLSCKQGQYTEAEPLSQRALSIWEQNLGPEHSMVGYSLNVLGNIAFELGKYVEAESLCLRTLRIWEQTLGSEHSMVGYSLHNLAEVYMACERYAEAEWLHRRILRIWEQTMGPEHPDIAFPLEGLANLSRLRGEHQQAELLYQRACTLREQALGVEHPDVARSLNGLATLYCEQGQYEQAESLSRRALAIQEKHLYPQHPETAKTLAALARLYRQQGNREQARAFLQRACTILEQRLGRAHPETRRAFCDYLAIVPDDPFI